MGCLNSASTHRMKAVEIPAYLYDFNVRFRRRVQRVDGQFNDVFNKKEIRYLKVLSHYSTISSFTKPSPVQTLALYTLHV